MTPCEVAGRIDKKYDRDWYSFTAKKGDVLMIELFADRIGSAMDTYLNVRSGDGKQDIANEGTLDDDPEILHPTSFFNRSGDPPAYKFTAAADGKYLIMVGSREANVSFGPRCAYRLRIAPPKPDFRAVVMARSRELPATTIALSAGEFTVKLVFPKETKGVTAREATIPAGQNEVKVAITADKDVKAGGINNIVVQAVAMWDAKYPTTHEAKFNLNISK